MKKGLIFLIASFCAKKIIKGLLKLSKAFFKKDLTFFQQTLDFFLRTLFCVKVLILFRQNDLSKFLQLLFHEIGHNVRANFC